MNFEEESFYRAINSGQATVSQWMIISGNDTLEEGDEVQFEPDTDLWSKVAPFFIGKRKDIYFPTSRVRRFGPTPPKSPPSLCPE